MILYLNVDDSLSQIETKYGPIYSIKIKKYGSQIKQVKKTDFIGS